MTLRTTGTRPCYDKPIPQTVFLGSSVTGFNISLGWGAQASSLTVNLVDDVASNCSNTGGNLLSGFSGISGDEEDDAYYNSSGDQLSNTRDATSGQLVLPGKLYFHWNGTKFVSRYWKNPDPGFFGLATRWQSGGGFNPKVELNRDNNGFDIIGNPVFFKMEDFEFSGVIKNWEK